MTCEKRSTAPNSTTRTVPGSQTRPRSLRPRSTSIRCSARSFSLPTSSAASSASLASVPPRGRVPAIGCSRAMARAALPSIRAGHRHQRFGARADDVERRRSGAGLLGAGARQAQQVHVRARVAGAQQPVDVQRIGVGRHLEPLAHRDLEDVARPDGLERLVDGALIRPARGAAVEGELGQLVGRRRHGHRRRESAAPSAAVMSRSRATASS